MIDDRTLFDLLTSLSREIAEVDRKVQAGFERIEARLAKQGGIISGGARQVSYRMGSTIMNDTERGLLSALPDPEPVRCVHCGMRRDEAREAERDAYFCPHTVSPQRHEFPDGVGVGVTLDEPPADPIERYLAILQPQNEALIEPQQPVMMAIAVGILLGVQELRSIHKLVAVGVGEAELKHVAKLLRKKLL